MISKEKKAEIIKTYGRTPEDTGSPEVQIAILTERIRELTEHLKVNKKDLHLTAEKADGLSAIEKTYDTTTDAKSILKFGITSADLVSGDSFTVDSSNVSATFDTKNQGSDKDITISGLTITGDNSDQTGFLHRFSTLLFGRTSGPAIFSGHSAAQARSILKLLYPDFTKITTKKAKFCFFQSPSFFLYALNAPGRVYSFCSCSRLAQTQPAGASALPTQTE